MYALTRATRRDCDQNVVRFHGLLPIVSCACFCVSLDGPRANKSRKRIVPGRPLTALLRKAGIARVVTVFVYLAHMCFRVHHPRRVPECGARAGRINFQTRIPSFFERDARSVSSRHTFSFSRRGFLRPSDKSLLPLVPCRPFGRHIRQARMRKRSAVGRREKKRATSRRSGSVLKSPRPGFAFRTRSEKAPQYRAVKEYKPYLL